eukprot:365029-Chlamydomonas_euryale.AAC.13
MGVGHCTRKVEICCDCPIVQGQRPQRRGGVIPGISLLSIASQVYVALLLHRTAEHIEPKLHEAQNGFRKGRGTTDAMFTLQSVVDKAARHQLPASASPATR